MDAREVQEQLMDWDESFIAIDTETTGLLHQPQARVIELGVVVFEHGKEVHEWSQFFSPYDVDWDDP